VVDQCGDHAATQTADVVSFNVVVSAVRVKLSLELGIVTSIVPLNDVAGLYVVLGVYRIKLRIELLLYISTVPRWDLD